jgi:hypothetical protein
VLRDLARRLGGPRRAAPAPSIRPTLSAGELFLVRIILDGDVRWRQLIADRVDPTRRGDPRVGRLIHALRRFFDDETQEGRDFVRWAQENVDDDDLMILVAEASAGQGPELTDDTVRMQLQRVMLEQWKAQARELTAAIRRAEDRDDLGEVAALQEKLGEIRVRRPDF